MANYGTGLDASFGIGQESSSAFNTAVTPTRFFPLTNETLSNKKNVVMSMGLRGGLYHTPLAASRRISTQDASGNVTLDVQDRSMSVLFKNMLGASSSSNVGSAYTWTHTMAGTKGLSFTAQLGKPSTDGVINNFLYTGGKIADWELSVSTDALVQLNVGMDFAAELTQANSPAISSITQTGTAGSTTYYYRISAVVGGVEQPAGAEVSTALSNATLSVSNYNVITWSAVTNATSYNVYRSSTSGANLKIGTSSTTSYNDQSNTAGTGSPTNPLFTSPTYTSGMSAFSFSDVSVLTLGGATVAAVKKLSVKSANPLATSRFFLGSQTKAEQVVNGYRTVTGTMEAEFTSLTALYKAYKADSQLAFQFRAVSPNIITGSTNYSLQVDIPALFLDGDTPNIAGPDVLTMTIPFTGLSDGTNSPITITQVTTDTTAT